MTRKRLWEISATTLLVVAVAGIVGGFFAWRERQRRLDRELVRLLESSYPPSDNDCTQMLTFVRQGANVRVRSPSGFTVLIQAAWGDNKPLLREGLARCAEIEAETGQGWTALRVAAAAGHVDCAALLLKHGADPNRKNPDGLTALACVQGNHQAMIRLLKQHGAKE
jgi:ankyrin repeat protein